MKDVPFTVKKVEHSAGEYPGLGESRIELKGMRSSSIFLYLAYEDAKDITPNTKFILKTAD